MGVPGFMERDLVNAVDGGNHLLEDEVVAATAAVCDLRTASLVQRNADRELIVSIVRRGKQSV